MDPERIAERVHRGGWDRRESLIVALAAHATIALPWADMDAAWMASAAARIGDEELLLETAGVVFAFNTINRIADARRVQLECRLVRGMKPIRGWIERRLASLTGLAYDLSFRHHARHSSEELLDRVSAVFERLGAPATPELFQWLSRSPVVLEGVLEMLEVNVMSGGVRLDFLREAAAIAAASRAMPGSGLGKALGEWSRQGSSADSDAPGSGLASACRRYLWQVANAAHTITDEQIRSLAELGLDDAELLDLTLASSVFSALAIIEPISAAATLNTGRRRSELAAAGNDRVQAGWIEGLAV